MGELLVGYDARETTFNLDELWPAEMRARYLLVQAAKKPLSVDTFVWPSVFDTGQAEHQFPKLRHDAGLGDPTKRA